MSLIRLNLKAIKNMLTTIFRKYQTEMKDLRDFVSGAEMRLESMEQDMGQRINRVEDFLTRKQREVQRQSKKEEKYHINYLNTRLLCKTFKVSMEKVL